MKLIAFLFAFGALVWGQSSGQSLRIKELMDLRKTLSADDKNRSQIDWDIAALLAAEGHRTNDTALKRRYYLASIRSFNQLLVGNALSRPLEGERKLQALLQLGSLQLKLGQEKAAFSALQSVLTQSPIAILQMKAATLFAEHYEQKKNLTKANIYFTDAVKYCQDSGFCPYLYHRLSWVQFRQKNYAQALSTLQSGLWDDTGGLREEAIRDYVYFWSLQPERHLEAIREIDEVQNRSNRTDLLLLFSDELAKQGSLPEALTVLETDSARQLTPAHSIRILGLSVRLAKRDLFQQTISLALAGTADGKTDLADAELLRNLAIRLEGEVKEDASYAKDLKDTLELYLLLFPTGPDAEKVCESYLALEEPLKDKYQRLSLWLNQGLFSNTPSALEKFQNVLLELSHAIQWQDLETEIAKLSENRQHSELLALIDGALSLTTLRAEQKKSLQTLRIKTEFNWAMEKGPSEESLAVFMENCEAKRFFPHSCQNASKVSVNLGKIESYLQSRRKIVSPIKQAQDLELVGKFQLAADKYESLWTANRSIEQLIRLAMLRELAGQYQERDRLTKEIRIAVKASALLGEWEDLVFAILDRAGELGHDLLSLPWSKRIKAELMPFTLDESRRILNKINIHGEQSERAFKKRTQQLEWVTSLAERAAKKARPKTAKLILSKLSDIYQDLADAIQKTPLPAKLSKANREVLAGQISNAAKPFAERAVGYLATAKDIEATGVFSPISSQEMAHRMESLRLTPWKPEIQAELIQFFENEGRSDLVGYFEGRLETLNRELKS